MNHRSSGQATLLALLTALLCVCTPHGSDPNAIDGKERLPEGETREEPKLVDAYVKQRKSMVSGQMRDVRDSSVLAAMSSVPRHLFVPAGLVPSAYEDRPLLIGHGQTISQPYIVAFMTQSARLKPGDRVLEIGTGSGYQAAILAELGCEVWSIELLPELHAFAKANLKKAGYDQVRLRCSDGYAGWPEEAPFDAILVTAAPPEIPETLKLQLAEDGRLVVPVGPQGGHQELIVLTRKGDEFHERVLFPVRFVPMLRPDKKD